MHIPPAHYPFRLTGEDRRPPAVGSAAHRRKSPPVAQTSRPLPRHAQRRSMPPRHLSQRLHGAHQRPNHHAFIYLTRKTHQSGMSPPVSLLRHDEPTTQTLLASAEAALKRPRNIQPALFGRHLCFTPRLAFVSILFVLFCSTTPILSQPMCRDPAVPFI